MTGLGIFRKTSEALDLDPRQDWTAIQYKTPFRDSGHGDAEALAALMDRFFAGDAGSKTN